MYIFDNDILASTVINLIYSNLILSNNLFEKMKTEEKIWHDN